MVEGGTRDDRNMTPMKIVQFSRPPPTPVVHLHSKFFHSLTLDVHFQTNLPSLQMITNQFKENIIQGCYQVLPSGRLSFTVSTHNILACAVVQKYHDMSFIYIIHIFSTHFAINLFY